MVELQFLNTNKGELMRHAVINNDSKKVVNIVIWEGAEWLPPRNHIVVRTDKGNIGDIYDEKANDFKPSQS